MTDYVFKAGRKDLAPLLLLHSTGGDEHQLVEIAEMIAPSHPILSIRGRINEQGVNRYFKLHDFLLAHCIFSFLFQVQHQI